MIAPTIHGVRSDPAGDGHFNAPRGRRLHRGCDYISYPPQPVVSPHYGRIVRIARPYASDLKWLGVLLRNSIHESKIFYVDPDADKIGTYVQTGDVIGWAQPISNKYPGSGMLDHVHWQVVELQSGHYVDPQTLVKR